ncbi:MAG TPA: hypothetical protein VIH46_01290 [Candidatus Acidoferrales bacterium]
MIGKDSRVRITRGILAGRQGTVLQDVGSSRYTFAKGEPWVRVKLDGAELPILFVTFDLKEILPVAGFGSGQPAKAT